MGAGPNPAVPSSFHCLPPQYPWSLPKKGRAALTIKAPPAMPQTGDHPHGSACQSQECGRIKGDRSGYKNVAPCLPICPPTHSKAHCWSMGAADKGCHGGWERGRGGQQQSPEEQPQAPLSNWGRHRAPDRERRAFTTSHKGQAAQHP